MPARLYDFRSILAVMGRLLRTATAFPSPAMASLGNGDRASVSRS
ncbi:MAG TPA: hypothetical protein VF624_01380 [Tepidisphaeraceae bacterium]